MFIKNNDIHLMVKMENIIGLNAKTIFGEDKSKTIEIDGMEITYYDFIDYINLIDRILNNKKKLSNRANAYNKAHKEYHRLSCNMADAKRRGDMEKYNYWKNKLKEYKLKTK
jgi:hypothetical protein